DCPGHDQVPSVHGFHRYDHRAGRQNYLLRAARVDRALQSLNAGAERGSRSRRARAYRGCVVASDRKGSFPLSNADHVIFAIIGDIPRPPEIVGQVVVLQRAPAAFLDPNSLVIVTVDTVAPQDRVTIALYQHARIIIAGDVVVLQRSPAAVMDNDAACLAVADLVMAQDRVAAGLDLHARVRIAGDVVVLQRSPAIFMDIDADRIAVTDPVTAQGRVGTGLDLHARERIPGNIIVLQRAQAIVVDVDPPGLAVVDLVAAQSWVCAIADIDACAGLAADVTAVEIQSPLHDVDAKPHSLTACLAQGQVGDPTDARLKQHRVRSASPNLDL